MSEVQPKYYVKVFEVDKPAKVSKEITEELKGVVKGGRMAKMKLEAVDCPALKRQVPFLQCFVCTNFIRRFKGEVHCAGLPLLQA